MTAQAISSADYVIVGAGTAGSVLARRLLEQTNGTIIVLEAGESGDDLASVNEPTRWVENIAADHDWGYTYEPSAGIAGRTLFISRGKVLGGSGTTNGLSWFRGQRDDFDRWGEVAEGWDYDSVLPYFARSEDWTATISAGRGVGGPVHIDQASDLHPVAVALIESAQSCGMPYLEDCNVAEPLGVGPMNLTIQDGVRTSTWTGHLRPVIDDERLTVVTGAHATRLVIRDGRCEGVEVTIAEESQTITALREVVLTAGAIDTPRLLMRSGVGPADHLSEVGIDVVHALPGVGRNLQEHVILGGICFSTTEELPELNNNLEGSTLVWRSRPDADVPDLLYVAIQIPYVSPEIAASHEIPQSGFCIAPGLMRVESRGYVELDPGSPSGLRIQPNMLEAQADVDALVSAVEIGLELAEQPGFARLIKDRAAPGEDLSREALADFVRNSAMPYFHPVGTCAMGTGEQAVVGPDLRVHGIDGLRVADASIMPTITSGNTNAPTAMIAEKASDLISGQVIDATNL